MTERIKKLYEFLLEKRKTEQKEEIPRENVKTDNVREKVQFFTDFLQRETPVLYEGDTIGFNRSVRVVADGDRGNFIPNYGRILNDGLLKTAENVKESMCRTNSEEKKAFGSAMLSCIDESLNFAERYRAFAKDKCPALYHALERVPKQGATTFYEACVFLKFCIYMLRIGGMQHVTLGRFDRYMYPFYKSDLEKGVSKETLFETVEEFFLSLNYDVKLYRGIQVGDDGQSMVLGGYDLNGKDMYNDLSEACMNASLELSVIDPKINLRVSRNTPIKRYEFATRLTKKGLGFPQYLNDDVVVPGLISLGYAPSDAENYGVAACWEFIVSGAAADVPNIRTFDFPFVVGKAIRDNLLKSAVFDDLMKSVKAAIEENCEEIIRSAENETFGVNPFESLFVDGCIESLTDAFNGGAKYFNFGCHGAGISTATDSLAAVQQVIYDEKSVGKEELIHALECNFEGFEILRNKLLSCPKMGQNDDRADRIACDLMQTFSDNLNNKDTHKGGVWRAGTGSAMEYVYKGEACPATADGRKKGAPYGSSFSPSLEANANGILSVVMSFTKFDLKKTVNGGPLTLEVHNTVLKNDVGIKKTAMLVSKFIERGGHELQINSVNRDTLLDAQKHPEKYPNLIVRVWGWSGYFNELDVKFQNHIIARTEFA